MMVSPPTIRDSVSPAIEIVSLFISLTIATWCPTSDNVRTFHIATLKPLQRPLRFSAGQSAQALGGGPSSERVWVPLVIKIRILERAARLDLATKAGALTLVLVNVFAILGRVALGRGNEGTV